MRRFFILLSILISITCNLYAYNSLIGKTIYLDYHNQDDLNEFLYNEQAYSKKSCKEKFHTTDFILGKPLTVIDEYYINKGNFKKETFCIALKDAEEKMYVIGLPLYFEMVLFRFHDAWRDFFNSDKVDFNNEGKRSYYKMDVDAIELHYILQDDIDSFDDYFSGHYFYPCIESNHILKRNFSNINSTYDIYGRTILFLFHKYKYIGVKLIQEQSDKKTWFTMSVQSSINDTIINFPIKSLNARHTVYLTLDSLKKCIIRDDKYLDYCSSLYDDKEISPFIEKYKGKKVFVNNYGISKGIFSFTDISDMDSRTNVESIKGVFDCIDFLLMKPQTDLSKPYEYFMILKGSDSLNYAISKDRIKSIVLTEDEVQQKKAEIDRQARLKKNAEEEEYRYLVKTYGKANADIINSGEIRLGFSTSMCVFAWGVPKSRSTTTTRRGVRESWYYETGEILIFENDKLVLIHESD